MLYEIAETRELKEIYEVVQHTIKTVYPQYYPKEVVDFFCMLHSKEVIAKDIEKGCDYFVRSYGKAVLQNGELDFVYQHMNKDMQIKTGKCHSLPTIFENGKIQLSEQWEWTSGDFSKGESLLVEV